MKRLKNAMTLTGDELQEELAFVGELAVEYEHSDVFDDVLQAGFQFSWPNSLLHAACSARSREMTLRLIKLSARPGGTTYGREWGYLSEAANESPEKWSQG